MQPLDHQPKEGAGDQFSGSDAGVAELDFRTEPEALLELPCTGDLEQSGLLACLGLAPCHCPAGGSSLVGVWEVSEATLPTPLPLFCADSD